MIYSLEGKNKIVLYSYDSFLFDFQKRTEWTFKQIKQTIEQNNTYRVKVVGVKVIIIYKI